MRYWLIIVGLTMLASCSTKYMMKNCEHLGQGYYQCERP